MKNALRFFPVVLFATFLLAASPAALGDDGAFQIVAWDSSSGCSGFLTETLDGTVTGCTPLSVPVINTEYSVAANGSVVFMAADNTNPSAGDQGSIWLVRPDGSSVHLDASPWDFGPTISYDGSKVVFARFDPVTWSSDLYSINSDGSDLHLVVSGGGTNYLTAPTISPDGSAIAYWCGPANYATGAGQGCGPLTDGSYRVNGVMRVNSDGSDPRMILIGAGDNLEPSGPSDLSWSPDGRWLALDGLLGVDLGNGDTTAQRQIFEYHTDGSDLFDNADPTRQVTHETDQWGPAYPQFSPDGSELLYMEFVDDQGNQGNFTYMIDPDGTNRHELPVPYGEFVPTATPVAPPPLVDAMHITVPSVHALRVKAARSDLLAHNLTVGRVTFRYSAKVRKSHVLAQYPKAGAVAHRTARMGPSVRLVVSRGRRHPHR